MASPVPDICPNNPVSVVSDTAWQTVTQTGMEDPSGEEWNIVYRTENVGNHAYDDEIWIKLARDVSNERLYTGGYYRTADFSGGGIYQVGFLFKWNCLFFAVFSSP
jgi:RimJ/RimL family protein N-acetyltransferase